MKRYIVAGGVVLFALVIVAILASYFNRPSETQYRLARGRAQLYTENYLAALQTLRDFPDATKAGPQAHSYLGAAYLKLHLYKAAIKEFSFAKGVWVAAFCGVMSACMSYGFAAGKPIAELAVTNGASDLWRNLPVLIITGYSTESSAIEAVNLGVAGYLTKPFRVPQVLAAAAKALGE